VGNICLEDEYYIKLKEACLTIHWISASGAVRIGGPGSIPLGEFSELGEQSSFIHDSNRTAITSPLNSRIRRLKTSINVIKTEARISPPTTEDRILTADQDDIISAPAVFYDTFSDSRFPITDLRTISAELKLIITGAGPGQGGTWIDELTVVNTDTVLMWEFADQFKIKDARFLTFNDLINGVDFTIEQIPGIPTFCNKNLIITLLETPGKSKLIPQESSIEKEIDFAIDPIPVKIVDNLFLIFGNLGGATSTLTSTQIAREYWLLEPPTQELIDAFNDQTPNDALFDDVTSLANMIEAVPGLDATIFGIIRTFTADVDTLQMDMNVTIFGTAFNGTVASVLQQDGIDYLFSTNTIQFSKDKPLFAGNGGSFLVGF